VPITFVSNIQRHASSSASATGSRPFAPPALFGLGIGDVQPHGRSVDLGGDPGAAVDAPRAEHDVETGLGQRPGGGGADAGAGAGDDCGGSIAHGTSLEAGWSGAAGRAIPDGWRDGMSA
jgi:hypothetical protein